MYVCLYLFVIFKIHLCTFGILFVSLLNNLCFLFSVCFIYVFTYACTVRNTNEPPNNKANRFYLILDIKNISMLELFLLLLIFDRIVHLKIVIKPSNFLFKFDLHI